MRKAIWISLFVTGMVTAVSFHARAQTVEIGPVTLPLPPSNSLTVESGQTLDVTSNTSITLKPGVHFKPGSHVLLQINAALSIPPAPNNPQADLDMNWTLGRSYRADGTVIGEQKSFFDHNGRPLQQQYKDLSNGHVLAAQTLYDAAGRPSLSTLSAPINNADFAYKADFVQDPAGNPYTYHNFDRYRNGTGYVDKAHSPDAVGGKGTPGTLGWYYSNNNSWEPHVDITDYPYVRQSYSHDGTGMPVKSAGPGDEYRMGKGHEVESYNLSGAAFIHYWQTRNKFFSESELGAVRDYYHIKNFITTQAQKNQNGEYAVQVTLDGQMLLTGRVDPTLSGGGSVEYDSESPLDYPPYFLITHRQWVEVSGSGILWNLTTGEQISITGGDRELEPGYYRIGPGIREIEYSQGIVDLSYFIYNQLGQLVASIPPEGVKKLLNGGINNYNNKEDIPFITLYRYDGQGRLVWVKEPDAAGPTEFVYRRDGAIRFSQNAKQRPEGRYSFTNYDYLGRAVESGEFKPGTGGVAFNADISSSTPMRNILENTTAQGGAWQRDQV